MTQQTSMFPQQKLETIIMGSDVFYAVRGEMLYAVQVAVEGLWQKAKHIHKRKPIFQSEGMLQND
jgi:hypothetical protein